MNTHEQLNEREKELNCIYRIDKLIEDNLDIYNFLMATCEIIINGFQFPYNTSVMIEYGEVLVKSPYFKEGKDCLRTDITSQNTAEGKIEVFYNGEIIQTPFLQEEQHLIDSISKRVSDYLISYTNSENNSSDVESNLNSEIRQKVLKDAVETLDFAKLGIYSVYLIGSVKNHNCGISSDIDLIVYFDGNDISKEKTELWFRAWSESIISSRLYMANIECIDCIFDLHFITKQDIELGSSYAVMIGSLSNSARLIKSIL